MWRYRLRRLFRVRAVPGWLAALWGIIEKASVIAWLKDIWTSLSPTIVVVTGYGAVAGILGIGWLAWLVFRKPRTINLQEFARARGERGLVLKNEIFTKRVIEGPATIYINGGTVIKDS